MSDDCSAIGPGCTVQDSVYGYFPSLGANVFFLTFFAICFFVNVFLGIRHRTWTYMIAVGLGCLTEAIGYIGRLLMRQNPFADYGFITQICCLIIAPAFNSAAIYLTLKHITLCFGPEFSFIKPRFYTYIFICADFLSLLLQAIGGAIASGADTNSEENTGDDLMLAGIGWQVASLFFFAVTAGLYILRRYKGAAHVPLSHEAAKTLESRNFRLFIFGVATAWLTIFIRCVFRIIEMAGGWRNPIMRNETDFIVLEGVMIVIAVACQTAFHPGIFFPRLSSRWTSEYETVRGKNSRDVSMENMQTYNAAV